MSVRRSPSRGSRRLRLLLPAVLTVATVLVPGVAVAEEGLDDPLGGVTGPLEDVLTGGGSGEDPPPPEPPSELDPGAVRDLLVEALAPLGIPESCVDGVMEDVTAIGDALAAGGEDLENLLTQLVGALQNGGEGLGPEALTENDLARALQDLITTLQEECVPTSPGGTPPPASGGQPPAPPAMPAAPAPAAAPVAPQQVSYPGYAPTGGSPEDTSGPVPLAALGGLLLMSGVGAAGYRAGTRAARSRG